ncbi:hypothetical protein [Pedobacter sp. B4-66]|uniref:hypothetical protein n=1 Tax=Pedobacter sp. B4-66 TaxID=2817280 RepID=UPI001BDA03DA|nr:hypothetical protein [Pedobacter sp. B4-66]
MQDKEFDKLFRDRFDGAEMQPSTNLWDSISKELSPKPKRSLPVYWMAAAVAVIAVTVGLLMPKEEKIRLQATAVVNNEVATDSSVVVTKASSQLSDVSSAVADKVESTPLIIAPRVKLSSKEKELAALQPNTTINRPVYKQPEVVKELAKVQPKVEPPKEEVVLAKVDLPVENTDVITETEPQENRGIRNVGDLVNYVVNKVDKREKKLIQFDTNDDNSSLVSINIGFIKFNKKSDK